MTRSQVWRVAEISVLGLAALTRSIGLNHRALWFDEAIEFWMSSARLGEVHQAVATATHDPPLYTYLLKLWRWGGQQEFWLRLPSLFFSLLAVAGIIVLGRQFGSRRTGIIAGLLLAVSAADIRYAQEVGQYSLLVCLVIWSLIFLFRVINRPGWGAWLGWGAFTMLGLYTHYGFAIFAVLTAGVVWLYFLIFNRAHAWKLLVVGAGIVLAGLPLLVFIIPNQINRLGAQALPFSWQEFGRIASQMNIFFWLSNRGVAEWPFPTVPPETLTGFIVILIIFALLRTRRLIDPVPLLVITWFGYYVVSRSGSYFFVPSRHALFLLPLLLVGVTQGVDWLVSRGSWGKLMGGAATLGLVSLALLAPREGQEDLRSAVAYWLERGGASQPTFVYYGATPGFRYQTDLQKGEISTAGWRWYVDCFEGQTTPECRTEALVYSPWLRGGRPEQLRAAALDPFGPEPAELWAVFSHIHPGEAEDFAAAFPDYDITDRQMFEGALVLKLQRKN